MNLCRTCGLDFSSVEAFDLHRVGTYDYTFDQGLLCETPRVDGRRCLGLDELTAAGWEIDARGRWVHPRELRKRLARGGDALSEHSPAASSTPRRSATPIEISDHITAPKVEA